MYRALGSITKYVLLTSSLLSGIAFAQSNCSNPAGNQVFVRAEGTTELLGNFTFTCSGPGGLANVRVFLTPALPVTSAMLATATAGGFTEAIAVTTANQVQGVVDPSGTSITFTGVSIPATVLPATTLVTITNIRVNVSSVAVPAGFPPVIQESAFLSGAGANLAVIAPTTVALVVNGLGAQSATSVATNTSLFGNPGSGAPANIAGCAALLPALPSFFVKFGEGFAGAFKQQGSAALDNNPLAPYAINSETGYVPAVWPNTPGASNIAVSATRIRIILTNVPQNAMVYFPVTPGTDSAGLGTLALTGSETGALAPFGAIPPTAANGLPTGAGAPGLALVGNSGGTVEAVYEVTSQAAASVETYSIPVYFAWIANSVTGTGGQVGISVSFAPITPTTPAVPSFVVGPTTTPILGPVVSSCTTSLLFPFVTNESGFDTALIISNTSSDPYGVLGAVGQSGTCNLNFYGVGAPTPSTNVPAPNGTGAGGAYVSGQTYAFTLSSVAVGFQGYVIAVCNFQYAHAYASLTSSPGTPSATAMGYPAVVLARGAGGIVDFLGN